MRPTRWSILLSVALVVGGGSYVLTRSSYDTLPTPTIYTLVWILLIAVAETYVAFVTRARLAGRSGTRPINPLVVARFVALAKASAFVGALAVGTYGGYLIWVVRLESPQAHHDTRVAAGGLATGLLLTAAAMFLELVCRVPKRPGDDDETED